MDLFIQQSDDEKRTYYRETSAQLNFIEPTIEKDFWVSWTLKKLFSLPDWGSALTFKGGTSLSKAFGLIKRFSEDIDLVVDRSFFGFGGDDAPEKITTEKRRKRALDKLRRGSRQKVQDDLLPKFELICQTVIPNDQTWSVTMVPKEVSPEQHVLIFKYPTIYPDGAEYLKREVKMEFVTKSDGEPSETRIVQPFITQAIPNAIKESQIDLLAVKPIRTFYEKTLLLHEESFRPPKNDAIKSDNDDQDDKKKKGLSRHYHDLYTMVQTDLVEEVFTNRELFENLVAYRKIFFSRRWSDLNYDDIRFGRLNLIPSDRALSDWEKDYKSMRLMFPDDPPHFNELLRTIDAFSKEWARRSTP